jgi:hypothetical protein
MTRPFLITGCARSGTGWAAALFTALGHPCGHEEQFSYDRHGPLVQSEASWMAVPYLDSLPEDTTVLRIMRDPYKVVQSIMAKGFLETGDDYDEFVLHHRPEIIKPWDYLGRTIRYVALWDEPLEGHNLMRVDANTHVTTGAARNATGARLSRSDVGQARAALGNKVNASFRDASVPSLREIEAHPDGHLIRMRAERFGYAAG